MNVVTHDRKVASRALKALEQAKEVKLFGAMFFVDSIDWREAEAFSARIVLRQCVRLNPPRRAL